MKKTIVMTAGLAVLLGAMFSAARAQAPSRRHIDLPGRTGGAPYSDVVVAGDTVYLAGRLGLDPSTGKPPARPEDEVRLIMEGIRSALAAAGLAMDDVVSVQVFTPDVALLQTFNGVYRTYFTKGYPARAFVGSGPLLFGARFEVQAVAVRR